MSENEPAPPQPDPSAPPPPPPPPPPEVEAQPYDARAERGPTVDAPPPGEKAGASGGAGASFGPVLCHLAFLLGWLVPIPGLWVIAPLLVWQSLKADPAVDDQGREAVNFQLNVLAWSVLLPLTCVGIVLVPVLWAAAVVLGFVAAFRASQGELYRYPLTLRVLQA